MLVLTLRSLNLYYITFCCIRHQKQKAHLLSRTPSYLCCVPSLWQSVMALTTYWVFMLLAKGLLGTVQAKRCILMAPFLRPKILGTVPGSVLQVCVAWAGFLHLASVFTSEGWDTPMTLYGLNKKIQELTKCV